MQLHLLRPVCPPWKQAASRLANPHRSLRPLTRTQTHLCLTQCFRSVTGRLSYLLHQLKRRANGCLGVSQLLGAIRPAKGQLGILNNRVISHWWTKHDHLLTCTHINTYSLTHVHKAEAKAKAITKAEARAGASLKELFSSRMSLNISKNLLN